jgi:large subunit ribosomal protein L19
VGLDKFLDKKDNLILALYVFNKIIYGKHTDMSHHLLQQSSVVRGQLRNDIPDFKAGTVVEVYYKIKEGTKERVQVYKGIVISRHNGNGLDATFTVLKNSTQGIKVFRTFPIHSPSIDKVVVVSQVQRGKQSKLYYLADRKDPIKSFKAKSVKIAN